MTSVIGHTRLKETVLIFDLGSVAGADRHDRMRGSCERVSKAALGMPPNEECPSCHQKVLDWHVEWYNTEGPLLYKGLAALDCPLCGQAVGFQQGKIGPAPPGAHLVRRYADKAAEWAAAQAVSVGGTLQGYTASAGAGAQYAGYWTALEIRQADANQQAKTRRP